MSKRCPQCNQAVQELARYCARCGHSLGDISDASAADPRKEPSLLPAPPGFSACDTEYGLYYKWESGWGGQKLLGTETQVVLLFNAGATMTDVALKISALDARGRSLAEIRPCMAALPRGETTRVDVPSYELPDDVETLTVASAAMCNPYNQTAPCPKVNLYRISARGVSTLGATKIVQSLYAVRLNN